MSGTYVSQHDSGCRLAAFLFSTVDNTEIEMSLSEDEEMMMDANGIIKY